MKRCLALLALALPLLYPAAARADLRCQLSARPLGSALVIHGGAWYGGSASSTSDLCWALAALGYRARSLEYPLRSVSASVAYAQTAAAQESRLGRPVYAVGTSAGGTVAEYLAVRGDVDGALAVAPLSDMVDFEEPWSGFWDGLAMTPELRRRWSPYHNIGASAPLQIVHSRDDEVVPYEQSVRMVRRCGSPCDLVTLDHGGGHTLSIAWQLPAAFRWFLSRGLRPLSRRPAATGGARGARASHVPRRWLRVAKRAFPRHCRPVRLRYQALAPPRWESTSRARCTLVLARRLRHRPAWVQCTALVHAFGHLTARWSARHSADPRSVMYPRIRRSYRGPRSRCPRR